MASVVADTHAIIWYLDAPAELSATATAQLDAAVATVGEYIYISAITLVEIRYLVEKNRIDAAVLATIEDEIAAPTPRLIASALNADVAAALAHIPRSVVHDMPDRIIAATAFHLGLSLISRDSKIQSLTNIAILW
jgi:PIN domain nuclease of toxin-antitoxin system